MTEEGIAALKKAADAFEQSISGGDLMESAQADVAFHEIIAEATGNRRLKQMLHNIRGQAYRYRLENLKYKTSHHGLIRQHRMIIRALEDRDEEEAAKVVRLHIQDQKMSIIENLNNLQNNTDDVQE